MDEKLLPRPVVQQSALWMVVATIFFDGLGVAILVPMLAPFAKSLGASNVQVGYLFSAPCLASFLSSFVLSGLTRRLGRKTMLVLSLLGTSAAALCQGVAVSYQILLFGRALGGLWQYAVPLAKVYVNEAGLKADENSHWFAQVTLASTAAQLFGPALGGTLALYGYNIPSLVTCAVLLSGSFFAWLYIADNAPPKLEVSSAATKEGVKSSSFQLNMYCLASTFTSMTPKMHQSVFALFAIHKYQLRSYDIGIVFLMAALGTMLASRLVRPLVVTVGPRFGVTLAAGLQALGSALVPLFPGASESVGPWEYDTRASFCGMVACFVMAEAFGNVADSLQSTISKGLGDQPRVQSKAWQFRQGGKVVAPMVAVYLFDINLAYPWFVAGISSILSIACIWFVESEPAPRKSLESIECQLSHQETLELGEFVASLLEQRNLDWARDKSNVKAHLERVISEAPADGALDLCSVC